MMSRDPGALSYLLSSGSISIPKMCFSRAQGTKPNCTEYMGKWKKKSSGGGGEEEGDVWDWGSVSNVLMRPAWSFQVNSGEKQILHRAP